MQTGCNPNGTHHIGRGPGEKCKSYCYLLYG